MLAIVASVFSGSYSFTFNEKTSILREFIDVSFFGKVEKFSEDQLTKFKDNFKDLGKDEQYFFENYLDREIKDLELSSQYGKIDAFAMTTVGTLAAVWILKLCKNYRPGIDGRELLLKTIPFIGTWLYWNLEVQKGLQAQAITNNAFAGNTDLLRHLPVNAEFMENMVSVFGATFVSISSGFKYYCFSPQRIENAKKISSVILEINNEQNCSKPETAVS